MEPFRKFIVSNPCEVYGGKIWSTTWEYNEGEAAGPDYYDDENGSFVMIDAMNP
jgi:hypothetical protein